MSLGEMNHQKLCVVIVTLVGVLYGIGTSDPSACEKKILKDYPHADCSLEKDKEACRAVCEAKGEKKCQGNRGEIRKLNCKRKDGANPNEPQTCCCDIKCESASVTRSRLNQSFHENQKPEESSGLCVDAPKEEIKNKLKELCRTNMKVQVARKFCMDEKKGKYFCLKEGKCFGTTCTGCVKHECEIDGKKSIINPPEDFMKNTLRTGNLTMATDINVEDKKDTLKLKKWCTVLQDRSKCAETCRTFGDKMCKDTKALSYSHEDLCKEDAKECSCCCSPACEAPSGGKDFSAKSSNDVTSTQGKKESGAKGEVDQAGKEASRDMAEDEDSKDPSKGDEEMESKPGETNEDPKNDDSSAKGEKPEKSFRTLKTKGKTDKKEKEREEEEEVKDVEEEVEKDEKRKEDEKEKEEEEREEERKEDEEKEKEDVEEEEEERKEKEEEEEKEIEDKERNRDKKKEGKKKQEEEEEEEEGEDYSETEEKETESEEIESSNERASNESKEKKKNKEIENQNKSSKDAEESFKMEDEEVDGEQDKGVKRRGEKNKKKKRNKKKDLKSENKKSDKKAESERVEGEESNEEEYETSREKNESTERENEEKDYLEDDEENGDKQKERSSETESEEEQMDKQTEEEREEIDASNESEKR